MAGEGPQWEAAKDLSVEMMKRFDRVLVDTPTVRARRAALAFLPRFREATFGSNLAPVRARRPA